MSQPTTIPFQQTPGVALRAPAVADVARLGRSLVYVAVAVIVVISLATAIATARDRALTEPAAVPSPLPAPITAERAAKAAQPSPMTPAIWIEPEPGHAPVS
jgi:hypothetical protein